MTYMEDTTTTSTTTTTGDSDWTVSYGSTPVATVGVPTPAPKREATKVKYPEAEMTFPQGKAIYILTGYSAQRDAECRVVVGKGYRELASRIISAAKRGDMGEAHRLLPGLPGVIRTTRADRINNKPPRMAKPKVVAKPKPAKKPAPPARVERIDVTDPFGDIEL